ncbi:MAG: response regulator transcription factor [Gaiellaceae bacterium]
MNAAAPAVPLRVLIADDHAPTRDDVRRALTDGGLIVCAEAADAARAVQQALETRPDICLLDLRMPGSGVAAAWEISARLPTTKVVMLTVSDDDASLFSALRAGAVGYLVKDLNLSLLPRTLQDVVDGKAALPRTLVARLVKEFHASDPRFRTTAVSGELGVRLTSREWDVLAALADGMSTREIGRRLQLKQSGVRAHISSIVRKLGVKDREQAIAFFRETTR